MGNKSPSAELSILSTLKLPNVPSTSSGSLNNSHPVNKMTKITSNINQQDHSSFNYVARSDSNQDSLPINDKKPSIVRDLHLFY